MFWLTTLSLISNVCRANAPQLRPGDFTGTYQAQRCSTALFDRPTEAVVRLVGNDVTIGVAYPQAWRGSVRGAVFKHVNEGWKVDYQSGPSEKYEEEKAVSWTTDVALIGKTRAYSYERCFGICAEVTRHEIRLTYSILRPLLWIFATQLDGKLTPVTSDLTKL